MANTITSTLVKQILQDNEITTLGDKLENVNLFSTVFTSDAMAPRSTQNVPVVNSTGAILTNPTSHESGDANIGNAQVTVDKLVAAVTMEDSNVQLGRRVEMLVKKAMQTLGNGILDTVLAPVTESNYASRTVDVAAGSFGYDDLKTLFGATDGFNTRNLFLDTEFYAQLLGSDNFKFTREDLLQGAGGYDTIRLLSRWDGAEAGTRGFVADTGALAVVAGVPYYSDAVKSIVDVEVVELPETGLNICIANHVNQATRAEWITLEICLGAAVGDDAALKLIGDTTTPAP